MARFQLNNLAQIRNQYPEMVSPLQAIAQAVNNTADQANADPTSTANGAPPQIGGFSVVEKGGIHDVQIQDATPANRGINYFADYSDTSDFGNYHTIDMGASQNHRANLGAGQVYWRGYSSYPTSDHSTPMFHGGTAPVAVGSGVSTGPAMQAKQGSTGFGPIYRNSSVSPVRK